MKLLFFLIAFSLVFLRAYFLWAGHGHSGNEEGTMTIENGTDYVQIKWSGKFKINDEEDGFTSISPGGYFKYRKNDVRLVAKSNLQGEIHYDLFDGRESLAFDEKGKVFIKDAIKELFAYGFYAKERMEKIYEKGGRTALLEALENLKTDALRSMYIDRLFATDSLRPSDLTEMIRQIGLFAADIDKVTRLNKLTASQLSDSAIFQAYFTIVEELHADIDKMSLVEHLLDKNLVGGARIDSVLILAAHLNADIDKMALYKRLLNNVNETMEDQWVLLIENAGRLNADLDKTNLLVLIAAKMPRTDRTSAAYLKVAKTLQADAEYGRAMRALE